MSVRRFFAQREMVIALHLWTFGKWWADHSAQRFRKLSGEFSPEKVLKSDATKPSRKFKLNLGGK